MQPKHLLAGLAGLAATVATAQPMQYPQTRKADQVDTYFGSQVADPYRWLEDDRSEETAKWVTEQNKVTFGYLDKIPYRDQLKKRLTSLYNYERYSAPYRAGNHIFYYKNDGLQNQAVLYKQTGDKEPHVFIDPNKLSAEGTTTVSLLDFSEDDKLVAFSVSKAGSDWSDIVVYNVETGAPLADTLHWCKFSGASFYKDGFFYSRYDAPKGSALSERNEYQKVYFHKIGEPQEKDQLVYEDKAHPLRYFSAAVTEDRQYLVLGIGEGTSGNEIWVRNLANGQKDFTKICPGFASDYDVVDTKGDRILVRTNDGAPNFRLVSIDPKNPAKKNWVNVLPEKPELLENVSAVSGQLYVNYLKDVTSRLYVLEDYKILHEIKLPGLGTASGVGGRKKDPSGYFTFTNHITPPMIMEVEPKEAMAGKAKVFRKPKVDFPLDQYEVNQVFYPSKDGTKVPMFLVHKKGLAKDGKRPTLLYGYGGFNISVQPGFAAGMLPLLEQGGVYAVANIRGGGEYGEKWHHAGMLLKKQNVFNDFIAAAEYLQSNGYTDKEHLAIEGRSNGGLLVGAVMTQRPDLFAVAFPGVGVMDMLRYQKFTVGWGWVVEYGSSDSAKYFKELHRYSPVHALKPGTQYPATMIVTADHDDRVVPAHSFKFVAGLQAAQKDGGHPTLIRIDVNAGHGAGKPLSKAIEERADLLAFMLWNVGVKEMK